MAAVPHVGAADARGGADSAGADVGVVVTLSSTYNLPYNLARRAQTADVTSGGRPIFNVVSSFNPNFGALLPPRSERYPRAAEFMDVVKKLSASWDPRREGKVPAERFWIASRAQPIDHHGTYDDVRGSLNVPHGPQGHPVIAQAGASEGGLDLAARHAEISYCNIPSHGAGTKFGRRVKSRATTFGRDPSAIRIVPGAVSILGDQSRGVAQARTVVRLGVRGRWPTRVPGGWHRGQLTIQPPRAPDDIAEFVDKVIPILQDRGVFRRELAPGTVRGRYGLPYPDLAGGCIRPLSGFELRWCQAELLRQVVPKIMTCGRACLQRMM